MADEGQSTLSDLMNNVPAPESVEAPPAEAAPEPQAGPELGPEPVRDEKGRFAPKTGVEDTPPPGDKLPQEEYGALRAVRDENKGLKSELETLKQQLQSLQQSTESPAAPPSIWEDENGALSHTRQQAVSEASFNARLDMSEMLASQAHEDFDAMKERFVQMMTVNPALQRQALESRHPWETAYKIAKNAAAAEELGATNLEELRATIRAEIEAELQQGQTSVQQPAVPPTLTGERNLGTRAGPEWGGPTALSDLLR